LNRSIGLWKFGNCNKFFFLFMNMLYPFHHINLSFQTKTCCCNVIYTIKIVLWSNGPMVKVCITFTSVIVTHTTEHALCCKDIYIVLQPSINHLKKTENVIWKTDNSFCINTETFALCISRVLIEISLYWKVRICIFLLASFSILHFYYVTLYFETGRISWKRRFVVNNCCYNYIFSLFCFFPKCVESQTMCFTRYFIA
jgi:hypothetical protein